MTTPDVVREAERITYKAFNELAACLHEHYGYYRRSRMRSTDITRFALECSGEIVKVLTCAQKEIDRLQGALEKYGKHTDQCSKDADRHIMRGSNVVICTCDLAAAKSPQK